MHTLSAGFLLAAAGRAASRRDNHADDAVVATLFSALAVESWINEVLFKVRKAADNELLGNLKHLKPLIAACRLEDRTTSLIARLDVIGVALTGKGPEWGKAPFQEFDLLLDVRNSLVHLRPEVLQI